MSIVQTIYAYINFLNQKEHHKNTTELESLWFLRTFYMLTLYILAHTLPESSFHRSIENIENSECIQR